MTYTFTMKDGLKWSDGEALDANDVLYSWNRLADENTAADYSTCAPYLQLRMTALWISKQAKTARPLLLI